MSGDDGTPLARLLREDIRRWGAMPLSQFMGDCLFHPEFGYYTRQPAIGAEGDFITAPEISQIFGELIGLWCAVVWQQMGAPARINLIELGPGRGTLMSDALRSAKAVPAFGAALHVHLVEFNRTLRETQKARLGDQASVTWHESWPDALGDEPTIVVGNEFLDAMPIDQMVCRHGRWLLREVDVDDDGAFVLIDGREMESDEFASSAEGDIRETSDAQDDIIGLIAEHARRAPTAALFIDYGYLGDEAGDTLQGVRRHRYVPPFATPGETDLTAHVNFSHIRRTAEQFGLTVDEPTTQAEFLGALGMIERASKLISSNPAKAGEIEAGVARLMAPNGMGGRFKAIGLRSGTLPPLPGFAVSRARGST